MDARENKMWQRNKRKRYEQEIVETQSWAREE